MSWAQRKEENIPSPARKKKERGGKSAFRGEVSRAWRGRKRKEKGLSLSNLPKFSVIKKKGGENGFNLGKRGTCLFRGFCSS